MFGSPPRLLNQAESLVEVENDSVISRAESAAEKFSRAQIVIFGSSPSRYVLS